VLALVIAGPWIGDQLSRFTTQLMMTIPSVAL
jgi:flagellar biosynthesis protein FliQ